MQKPNGLTAPLDFRLAVPLQRVKRLSIGTGAAIVVAIVLLITSGADGRDLLLRALLVPGIEVPRRTQVRLLTPDPLVIGKGESVQLRARAVGVVPTEGSALLQYDGERQPVPIRLDAVQDAPGEFAATVSAVTQSFTYRIHLNDGTERRSARSRLGPPGDRISGNSTAIPGVHAISVRSSECPTTSGCSPAADCRCMQRQAIRCTQRAATSIPNRDWSFIASTATSSKR